MDHRLIVVIALAVVGLVEFVVYRFTGWGR